MATPPRATSRSLLDGLHRVTRRLASEPDPSVMARDVLREALADTGASAGGVFVIDPVRGLAPLAASSPLVARQPGTFPQRVAASAQPLHLGRREEVAPFFPPKAAYGAALGVPLHDGLARAGSIVLFAEAGFAPGALTTAALYADLLSAALRLARVAGLAGAAGQGVELLARAGRNLAGTLDHEVLLTRILDGAEQLVGAVGGFVCLVEGGDRPTLRLGLFRWVSREAVRSVMAKDAFLDLLREPAPRLVPDAACDPLFAPLGLTGSPLTLVTVPLRVEATILTGLLVVALPGPAYSSPEEPALLQALADQAALAIAAADRHAKLRANEAEMSAVFGSIDNPVVVVDAAGRFLTINPAAEQLFALSADFDRGYPSAGRIAPPALADFLARGFGVEQFTIDWPTSRTFRAAAHDLRDAQRAVIGRVMVMVDVTAEREMEQMKSDFVAVIGHELRTPITVVKGMVRTLQRRGDRLTPEARAETLDTMARQTHRLERLIEDLLFVSQVETSRPPLLLEEVELVDLARRVLTALRDEWPSRVFHLETTHPEVRVVADIAKVEQVLRHLAENALKFSGDDVWVQIFGETTPDGGEVRIVVIDRGVGIYSGDIPRLFQRFGQIDTSLSRGQGGTGMGLYICRRLVEVHGGRIWCESQSGRGSSFHVALPVGLEPGTAWVGPEPSAARRGDLG